MSCGQLNGCYMCTLTSSLSSEPLPDEPDSSSDDEESTVVT